MNTQKPHRRRHNAYTYTSHPSTTTPTLPTLSLAHLSRSLPAPFFSLNLLSLHSLFLTSLSHLSRLPLSFSNRHTHFLALAPPPPHPIPTFLSTSFPFTFSLNSPSLTSASPFTPPSPPPTPHPFSLSLSLQDTVNFSQWHILFLFRFKNHLKNVHNYIIVSSVCLLFVCWPTERPTCKSVGPKYMWSWFKFLPSNICDSRRLWSPMATLLEAWRYGVCAVIDWPDVCTLWFIDVCLVVTCLTSHQ